MEQLDKVYDTFVNLEKNYKRSKKPRKEYLLEKFGGDINTGSFLILHALSREELVSAEDIDKMSTVRRIFNAIKDRSDRLDTIQTFNFLDGGDDDAIISALDTADKMGHGFCLVEQASVSQTKRDPMCYRVTAKNGEVVSLVDARYLRAYSPGLVLYGTYLCGGTKVKDGDIIDQSTHPAQVVERPEYWVK